MDIGKKIALCRKEAGLSQEALAAELGISRQAVSRWETGEAVPDTAKVIELSRIFSVTTDYLLLDDGEKTYSSGNELMHALNGAYLRMKKLFRMVKPAFVQMRSPLFFGLVPTVLGWLAKNIGEHYLMRGYDLHTLASVSWIVYIAGLFILVPSLCVVAYEIIKTHLRKRE